MDKGKKNNKLKKRLLIILLVTILIVIIFIISLVFYVRLKNENEKKINKQEYENVISDINREHYQAGEIIPDKDNIYTRLYDGTVQDKVLYGKIYYLVNTVIPNINNNLGNLSSEELDKYYDENKERVAQGIGIQDKEEFKSFVEFIKNNNLKGFINAKYDVNNYEDGADYAKIPLQLKYENCTITLDMFVAKRNGMEVLIIFKNQ